MLSNLTGIRGIAALWVFWLHFNEYFVGLLPGISRMNFIAENGRFGVDLFFCLSGFILGYVYFNVLLLNIKGNNLKFYFYKRLARLYPVYLATLAVAAIFYLIALSTGHEFIHESSSNISLVALIQNLLGVQTWFGTNSLNGPAWSVSAEFAAYLNFPILVLLLRRSGKSRNYLSLGLLILSIFIYELSLHFKMLLNQQLIHVLTEFTMGLCAFLLVRDLQISEKWCKGARKFVFFILLLSLFLSHSTIFLSSLIPLLLLVLIVLNFFYN
jgi:peptidoglycan/LPS O-acetylase OafA/YrhL